MLEEWGQRLDELSNGIEDPAEIFAVCLHTTGRLGLTHPDVCAVISDAGFSVFDSPIGLAPRAIRDLSRCVEAGRFHIANVVVAFTTVAGSLLALAHLWRKDQGLIGENDVDDVTEHLLRMFGLPHTEAHALAHKPLPPLV